MSEGSFERRFNSPESLEAGNAAEPIRNERITQIRREVTDDEFWIGDIYEYATEQRAVRLYDIAMTDTDITPENKERATRLYTERLEGEKIPHEFLLVRALHEQRNIEQDFGLPEGALLRGLTVNGFDEPAGMLMNDKYEVFSAQLANHKKALEAKGIDDEGMVIDMAGHILHEQMHDPGGHEAIKKDLLRDGNSIGEFTTVTTQLAYYLNRKFEGHGSYDAEAIKRGLEKIRAGKTDKRDHDIATAAGAELIRKRLQEVLPDNKPDDPNAILSVCRSLRSSFSDSQQNELLAALKNAIADSANQEQIDLAINDLREKPGGSEVKTNESTENSRRDVEGVKEAQRFFVEMGLKINEDSFVSAEISDDQLGQLSNWHKESTDHDIQMPTEKDLYRKTLLAASLWRQEEGDKTNYLFGKGAGVEVALRGRVVGRERRPVEFSYRSHSDFELYGVDYETAKDGSSTDVLPEKFKKVFGSQEYFPLSKVKGFENAPPTLLHDTAETVDFGGVEIKTPQLELMFLDKYIARESTPRPEGYDAELLARQYVLDRAQIHQYLDQLVIQPRAEKIKASTPSELEKHVARIKKDFNSFRSRYEQQGKTASKEKLLWHLNTQRQTMPEWEELKPEQIDDEGNIVDEQLLQRLEDQAKQKEVAIIQELQNKHADIDQLFDSIDTEFAASNE